MVLNGDVLTDIDIGALIAFHRERWCRGHHRAHAGRRPEQLRGRPHRRGRPGRGVHREAAARRGPHQPDQRRDLRARALGARTDRPGVRVSIERETFPGDRRRPARSTRSGRTPTGSTPGPPTPTCGPTATSCPVAERDSPPPGRWRTPDSGPACGDREVDVAGDGRPVARRAGRGHRGPGDGDRLGDRRRRRGRGRCHRDRLGPPARRAGGGQGHRRGVDRRSRGPPSGSGA